MGCAPHQKLFLLGVGSHATLSSRAASNIVSWVWAAMQSSCTYLIIIFWESDRLSYDDVRPAHSNPRGDDPIIVQLVVEGVPHSLDCVTRWLLEMLFLVESRLGLLVFVGPVEDGAKETSIDGTCVHDD